MADCRAASLRPRDDRRPATNPLGPWSVVLPDSWPSSHRPDHPPRHNGFDAFSDPRMPGQRRRSHRGDLGRRVRTCGGSTRAGVRSMIKQAALPGPRTTWRQIHAGWNNSEIAPRAHPLRRSGPPPPHRVRHRSRPTLPRSSASRRLTRWFALPDDRDRAIDGEPPRLAIGDRNGRRD